jgi:penicillin-binding protein-related factor A (putative recombinase)
MKRGEGLEMYILDRVRADGFTMVGKTDPPIRVLRWFPGNQFRGCFLEEGMLDLTGSARGYHFELEVKDCKGVRWPLSKLKPHQRRRMELLQHDGAVSGLALRLRGESANDDHVYLIPARRVMDLLNAEKKSIMLKDLQALEADGLVVRHEYRSKGSIRKFFELVVDTLNEV